MKEMFKPGLEVFLGKYLHLVQGKKVGLITNQAGLNRDLVSNIDLFWEHPEINLVALFAPEHGVRGNIVAGEKVSAEIDPRTRIRVNSLYGECKEPSGEVLEGIDVLVFDLQDVGVRFYTYLSTLLYCLKACGEQGLTFIVLDRPNPLGRKEEGNILRQEFKSFVGPAPILLRHGLTLGELAGLLNSSLKEPARLEVIPCQGWQGDLFRGDKGRWIPPSPGLPHFGSVLAYPGTCLFEGTNLSEGRGTANPFEFVGAPWIDPFRWREKLLDQNLPGVDFRPTFFYPRYSKHQQKECGGLQVYITDPERVDTVLVGLVMLYTCRKIYPEATHFISMGANYYLDLLLGSDQPRLLLEKGVHPEEITREWTEERAYFANIKREFLLYENPEEAI